MVMLCEPNSAHRAIAAIEDIFPKITLVTQNVDDLHERAGSKDVIHLHGSLHHPKCRACARPHELPQGIPEDPSGRWKFLPPRCNHCGGWIRPGVVWFGEDLPRDAWKKAKIATDACDVFICMGYPRWSIPPQHCLKTPLGTALVSFKSIPIQQVSTLKQLTTYEEKRVSSWISLRPNSCGRQPAALD